MTIMGNRLFILIFLGLFGFVGLYSQAMEGENGTGTEEEVRLIYGYVPYATLFAAIAPSTFLPYDTSKYIGSSTLMLGGIPSVMADPQSGFSAMGIAATGFASAFFIETFEDPLLDQYVAWPILNIAQKTQMWSYYNGYQQARINSIDRTYAQSMDTYSFLDLARAPWDMDNLRRPSVWIPLLAATGIYTTVSLLSTGGEQAVWSTGEAYLGDHQVPFFAGLLLNLGLSFLNNTFTAIGEESVFRGIGYEEFSHSLGSGPAMFLDSLFFPAMHIPYEIQSGDSSGQILSNAGFRIAFTISFDWAYDDGGLPASVASHFWSNVLFNTIAYLLTAGVPQDQ